jgi:hypothetical protein
MGLLLWAAATGIFLALFFTAYQTALGNSFLSAEKTSNCQLVEKTLGVETYYADWTGAWSSNDAYSSALTWYCGLLLTCADDGNRAGML